MKQKGASSQKLLVNILCYNQPDVVEQFLQSFNKSRTLDVPITLVDLGFPKCDSRQLKTLAEQYDLTYSRATNYGLAANLNSLARRFKIERDDVFVWLSPDVRFTEKPHWMSSILWAMQALPEVDFCGFNNEEVTRKGKYFEIENVKLLHCDDISHWTGGAFRGELFRRTGVQQGGKFYGGFESVTQQLIRYFNHKTVYLNDWVVEHVPSTHAYEYWKQLSRDDKCDVDFADWLRTC
jgi:hypothetical protein